MKSPCGQSGRTSVTDFLRIIDGTALWLTLNNVFEISQTMAQQTHSILRNGKNNPKFYCQSDICCFESVNGLINFIVYRYMCKLAIQSQCII